MIVGAPLQQNTPPPPLAVFPPIVQLAIVAVLTPQKRPPPWT